MTAREQATVLAQSTLPPAPTRGDQYIAASGHRWVYEEGRWLYVGNCFEGLTPEEAHLLRSPRNAARLLAALGRAFAGGGRAMSLERLREEAGLGPEG